MKRTKPGANGQRQMTTLPTAALPTNTLGAPSIFNVTATSAGITRPVDFDQVRRAASIFPDPETGFCVQSPFGGQRICAGGSVEAIAAAVRDLADDPCVYWHLHPVTAGSTSAKVGDHVRRRWLLVDIDRQKTDEDKELCASDEEREQSRDLMSEVAKFLGDRRWPAPVVVDSGNGWHLYYRVDLPNDEPSRLLFKGALAALHARYEGDARGEIDPKPYPATAGGKMPGTWAANRKPAKGRPHRLCQFLHVPELIVPVPADLLQQLAAEAPAKAPPSKTAGPSPFEIRANSPSLPTAYGKAVCDRVAGEIAMAPMGGRQQALWNGACRLGELVGARELEEFQACDTLYVAACRCGLDGDPNCGERGIRDTIKRGIAQGKANPKPAPDKAASAGAPTKAPGEGQNAKSAPLTGCAVIRTMLHVQPKQVRWIWSGRIPRGAITLLDGDPGLGKSTLTIDWASRVSRGVPMPQDTIAIEPADTLFLSAEDDPEATIRPRLDAAEADLSRVHVLEAVKRSDGVGPLVLPLDIGELGTAIRNFNVALVVIDPFSAYLDGRIDSHRDQDVRRCLHQLKELSQDTGVAIVLIRHLNKLQGGAAIYRGGGSIGIIGAARSAFVVGRDPDDAEMCVLAPVKCNLCAMPKALRYQLVTAGGCSRVEWQSECAFAADDILAQPGANKKTKVEQCASALKALLQGGPQPVTTVERELQAMGFKERSIKDARKSINVRSFKSSYDGAWLLELSACSPLEIAF